MSSTPIQALIVDDEPLAREELKYLLEQVGGVSVVAQGGNGVEAVDLIRAHRPDVVFLDVRMPGLDGFAVLRKLLASQPRVRLPEVVFATAFDQYAVKAFEVNAVDYLLKPFDSKRLTRTLDKVRARLRPVGNSDLGNSDPDASDLAGERSEDHLPSYSLTSSAHLTPLQPSSPSLAVTTSEMFDEAPGQPRVRLWEVAQAKLDALLRMVEEQAAGSVSTSMPLRTGRVVVRTGSRLLLVDQKDVCFATVEDGRITVVTKALEGDSNVRTLEELADQLDPGQFWRAHRSFLVNLQHIREVVPWFKSSYQLRMDDRNATEIPVSRSQTKRLRELFNL